MRWVTGELHGYNASTAQPRRVDFPGSSNCIDSADEDPAGTVGRPWEHTPSSLCPPRAVTCIHRNGSGDIRLSSYGLLSVAGVPGSRGDLAPEVGEAGPRPLLLTSPSMEHLLPILPSEGRRTGAVAAARDRGTHADLAGFGDELREQGGIRAEGPAVAGSGG